MSEMTATDVAGGSPVRWPGVVGAIGIVLGVLMFIDQAEDLLMAPALRSAEWWGRFFRPELADFIVRAMPPVAWSLVSAMTGVVLAGLLLLGSIRLRRRHRSGVALTRAWAWLVMVWVAIEMVRALWWLGRYAAEIPGVIPGQWEGYAAFGILVALVVTLGYPVFLLIWFARPAVRRELAAWAG